MKKLNNPDFVYTVEHYISYWKTLTEQLKQIHKKLNEQALSDAALHVQVARLLRGVMLFYIAWVI